MYNPNNPTDLPPPNVAVTQIQANFSQYGTGFGENHAPLNDSNQGKHTTVIFQQQISDPGNTNNYDCLYCKSVTSNSSTSQQMFLQVPQFLPNAQPNPGQQFTFNMVNTSGPIYQTFLPGGFIFYFGMITGAPQTITLVPAPTSIICAVANPNNFSGTGAPNSVNCQGIATNQFIINSPGSAPSDTFTWFAIGKQ